MKSKCGLLITLILCSLANGCGSNTKVAASLPTSTTCSNETISGTLRDSLTNAPVDKGWVALESGFPTASTKTFSFSINQQVTTDPGGGFTLCAPSSGFTSLVIFIAAADDQSGNAYPVLVGRIQNAGGLGALPMGGCTLTCLQGQQQTVPPTAITGAVTSNPIGATGTITVQYALASVDGSGAVWNLAMPVLNAPSINFDTSISCSQKLLCEFYTLALPSQKPLQLFGAHYTQFSGFPTYDIEAALNVPTECAPSTVTVFTQANGAPLTVTPGVTLSARDISFAQCH